MGPHRDQFSLPSFFTVYTTDIKYQSLFISVMGCISDGDENEYRTLVENFIKWCDDNFLQLNVTKTKDLSKRKAPMTPVSTEAWVWIPIIPEIFAEVPISGLKEKGIIHG